MNIRRTAPVSAQRRAIALSFALLAVPAAASAQSAPAAGIAALREDLVAIDRAYIPALVLTNRTDLAAVRRAMQRFETAWAAFRARYAKAPASEPDPAAWRKELAELDDAIARARAAVASGEPGLAHNHLEAVRLTLLESRTRWGLPYYLDGLTRYHEVMEVIYLAGKDRTAATLDEAAVRKLRDAHPEALALWRLAQRQPVDPEWRLTAAQQARVAQLRAANEAALDALRDALASGDRGRIAQAAVGIRAPFSQLFSAFGDFAAVEAR